MVFEILSICALIFSFLGFCISIYNLVQVEASKRSTHQIQYVGATPSDIDIEDTLGNVDNINKKYKEEVSEQLPFFFNEDKEKSKGLKGL